MPESKLSHWITAIRGKLFYGWVVVGVSALMIAINYGLMYSYSVYFKPLGEYFNSDRSSLSLIYSIFLITRGVFAITVGWLADRYGPIKLSVLCGFLIGSGLILSSQAHSLWQFFLTYDVLEAFGLSGTYGIASALVARWFTKNRGLAIGIMSAGSGLGTLLVVPGTERLINALDWSQSFLISGIAAGIIMIACAFFLRPPAKPNSASGEKLPEDKLDKKSGGMLVNSLKILKDSRMLLFMGALVLFSFGLQMIMVHLVNHATDVGISPLIAATFISIIGVISIMGRLSTGIGAEKIGLRNTLILTRVFLILSFLCLIFFNSLWSFYLFALIFGLCYGAEVVQIPLFISKIWGTRAMATLVGFTSFGNSVGGAIGPWVAGKIFDTTQSYHGAFIAGALASLVSLLLIFKLISQAKTLI